MKRLILLTILITFSYNLYSSYRSYGGCFTPKDSIKILVVFVGFNDNDTTLYMLNWPAGQDFPTCALEDSCFYTDYSQFDNPIDPVKDRFNISRWYYEMSNHTFKLIAGMVE